MLKSQVKEIILAFEEKDHKKLMDILEILANKARKDKDYNLTLLVGKLANIWASNYNKDISYDTLCDIIDKNYLDYKKSYILLEKSSYQSIPDVDIDLFFDE